MPHLSAAQRARALQLEARPDAYNFEHFRTRHLLEDVQRTIRAAGIHPGQEAPDFELPRAEGGSLRLSALRGRPVLLRFGSIT